MSDQDKINEAAEAFGKRSQKSGYERAESERGFKAGVAWRDSNPSDAVKGLVEALELDIDCGDNSCRFAKKKRRHEN